MTVPIRALIIEDSEDDAIILEHELIHGGFAPALTRVENAEQMKTALRQESWDVIIADYILPGFSALEAFKIYQETGDDQPFIIVSGKVGEEAAVESMRIGVHDYITKDNLTRLVPAVKRELKESLLRREHRTTRLALEKSRAEIERQRQREQEIRLMGQLVSGVAHEVRNPLNAITALLEALFQDIEQQEIIAPYRKHIQTQVERLNHLMQDLLELGKPGGESTLIPLALNEFIAKAADAWNQAPTAGSSKVVFSNLAPNDADVKVVGDASRLQQVLINLIENASIHSPSKSTIEIKLSVESRDAVIKITDRGSGINPDFLDRIFDPFFTTRKAGTGLGLGIARRIVEAHGGTLRVYNNEPPPGATAEIRLELISQ